MSEKVSQDIKEILLPQNTPEMGFESFKALAGDKNARLASRSSFLDGRIVNPELDYPKLNESELDEGIRNLNHILTVADSLDGEIKDAVWNSAAYRMAEMYWLKSLIYLNDVIKGGNEDLISRASYQHQNLNLELWGEVSPELSNNLFGEIFSQIENKKLSEFNQRLLKELREGHLLKLEKQDIEIPPVAYDKNKRLPEIPSEKLDLLGEVIHERFPYIFDTVSDFYEKSIKTRSANERFFSPEDIFKIYELLQERAKFTELEGVGAVYDPDSSSFSWDSTKQAVIVGGQHYKIEDYNQALVKIFHEYGVHGARSANGLRSNLPTLGTGLFTPPISGHNADYLTFEEGFAVMCEYAILGNKINWQVQDVEKYAAASLAAKGLDFRQVFEILWRIRVLMKSEDDQDLDQKLLQRAKRNTYRNVERIFRGTPTTLPRHNQDGSLRVLTYNKDLAYLNGMVKATQYLTTVSKADLELAFMGKFDATNPLQLRIAKKYISRKL